MRIPTLAHNFSSAPSLGFEDEDLGSSPWPACAMGSYRSGPSAEGTSKIIIFKTLQVATEWMNSAVHKEHTLIINGRSGDAFRLEFSSRAKGSLPCRWAGLQSRGNKIPA